MFDIDLLIKKPEEPKESWRWAEVESIDPVAIRLDGESSSIPALNHFGTIKVGMRVRVHMYNNQAMIVNKAGGGADGAILRIDSSRGLIFRNSEIGTVLNVTIYMGEEVITNIEELHALLPGAWLEWFWLTLEDEDFGFIDSADPMLSNDGFSLTVTPELVNRKTVFRCVLHA